MKIDKIVEVLALKFDGENRDINRLNIFYYEKM